MDILITAGGTKEKIDSVRSITNFATGRLGCKIACAFYAKAGNRLRKIYYLYGPGAVVPELPCVEKIPVEDAESLRQSMENLLGSQKIDAVVHSMAVSDYTVKSVTTTEMLGKGIAQKLFRRQDGPRDLEELSAEIAQIIRQNRNGLERTNKIRSDYDDLILSLKRTPKIIGLIKTLQPSTVLVGFKLLNDVSEQELLRAGRGVLLKNRCDFVLANDSKSFEKGKHTGFLIAKDGSFDRLEGKDEIAGQIAEKVLDKINGKGINP